MIAWLQKQSIGIRLCFAFLYCGSYYALLFGFGWPSNAAATISVLTVFPLMYGSAVQMVLDPHNTKKLASVARWAFLPIGVLCIGLMTFQYETTICVLIVAPIFIVLMVIGQAIMRSLLKNALIEASSDRVNVSLLMLPFLAVPVFGQVDFPQGEMRVTTQVVIQAPADVIWAHTYEIEEIKNHERVWTFSHNVLRTPLPIDAIVDGTVRKLRWSSGIRFEEHLTQVEQNQSMAWDFVFNAPQTLVAFDPHIAPQGGIVNMRLGSYVLSKLPDGDTLLTLETMYSVTTPINAYLALWGEMFLQDFHHAVLSVIIVRSEEAAKI
jgi:hypothetical protein